MKKKHLISLLCGVAILGLCFGWLGSSYFNMAKDSNSEEAVLNISTSVANHSFDSIIEHSDVIISGVVSEVTNFKVLDKNSYKTRYVSVTVTESFKGSLFTDDIAVIEINSYKGISGVNVENQATDPEFTLGDRVTLFLVDNSHGSYYVAGINQGAFYLDESARTTDTVYKHKQRIGNDLEEFTRSELLQKLSSD